MSEPSPESAAFEAIIDLSADVGDDLVFQTAWAAAAQATAGLHSSWHSPMPEQYRAAFAWTAMLVPVHGGLRSIVCEAVAATAAGLARALATSVAQGEA